MVDRAGFQKCVGKGNSSARTCQGGKLWGFKSEAVLALSRGMQRAVSSPWHILSLIDIFEMIIKHLIESEVGLLIYSSCSLMGAR